MPIINQKGMDNIMKNTKIELGMEELELVNGGWSILDPVKKAVKSVAKWSYDNMIDPVVDTCKEYVVEPAKTIMNHPYDLFTNIRVTGLESLADLLTGK